eukprot:9477382-Pyramimonas_sp.AAC.1
MGAAVLHTREGSSPGGQSGLGCSSWRSTSFRGRVLVVSHRRETGLGKKWRTLVPQSSVNASPSPQCSKFAVGLI